MPRPRTAMLLATCAAVHALSQPSTRLIGPYLCHGRPRRIAPIRLSSDGPDSVSPSKANASSTARGDQSWLQTKSGLRYVDEVVGSGKPAAPPQVLIVRCEGSLLSDGRRVEFDGRSQPLKVALGEPELPVVVEMISGMRIGGKRRVLLPPSADLRPEAGGGEIAGDDTVRFDVEVLGEETGIAAMATQLQARSRRVKVNWTTVFLLLSFIPYAIPEDQRPFLWQSNAPDKGLVGFMNDKLGTQTGTEEALDVDLFGESIGRLDFDLYR